MLIHWNELSRDGFQALKDSAAVAINFASTEQHAAHLPVGTDAMLGKAVLETAAHKAKTPIVVLPQCCYGFSPHHRFADGYITVSQRTLISYACDICSSVYENGFRRMFLLNSHGGNQAYLSAVIQEMGVRYGEDFSLFAFRYWDIASEQIAKLRETPIGGTGHAGEFETSVMMHLHPELVHADLIEATAPTPSNRWLETDLQGKQRYVKYKNFNSCNPNGQLGQPQAADAEKGARFFQAVTDEVAAFMDYFNP